MPSATTMIAPMHTRNYVKAIGDTALFFRGWREGERVVFAASRALDTRLGPPRMAPFTTVGLRCIASERRGHCRSGGPGERYNFNTLPDDLMGHTQILQAPRAPHRLVVRWPRRVSSPMAVPSRRTSPPGVGCKTQEQRIGVSPSACLNYLPRNRVGLWLRQMSRKASCDAATQGENHD